MDFGFDHKTSELQQRLSSSWTSASTPRRRASTRRCGRPTTAWGPAGPRGAQGRGARARAVEPVPAPDPRVRGRTDQPPVRPAGGDHGPQPVDRAGGHQLLGAGHREHGDALAVRDRGAAGAVAAPLLDGEIRSAFSMTEPDVASSDATNIATRIERDGDEYVINGRKWWTSGAMSPRCELLIVMGVTDPDAERHRQQSMILVPRRHPRGRDPALHEPVRLRGRPARRARGDRLRQRPRARLEPARRRGRRVPDRAGAARPRPHPPLHAGDRHGRARAGDALRAGGRPLGLRPVRSSSTASCSEWVAEAGWRSSRFACWCSRRRGSWTPSATAAPGSRSRPSRWPRRGRA